MSEGFGEWRPADQQGGDLESGEDTSPLFANMMPTDLMPADMSWSKFKSSLEGQMPQRVLGMNYQERFKMFCALLILSAIFFLLAFAVGLPMISIRPQKFALSFTCGSLLFLCSFAILRGPEAHFRGMIESDRLPFTAFYVGSMVATLYFTFNWHGASAYIVVLLCSAAQLLALLWYLVTFLPGGAAGMQMLTAAIYTLLRPVMVQCAKCYGKLLAKVVGWATGV